MLNTYIENMSKEQKYIGSQIEKWMNQPWKLKGPKKSWNEIVKNWAIKKKKKSKKRKKNEKKKKKKKKKKSREK